MSHTHLYQDSQTKSRKLSINVQTPAIFHTITLRERGRAFPQSDSSAAIYNGEDNVSRWFKATQSETQARSLSSSPSSTRSPSRPPSPQQQPGTPYISPPGDNFAASEVTLTDSGNMYPVAAVDPSVRLVDLDAMGGTSLRRINSPSKLAMRSDSATTWNDSAKSFSGSTINSSNHPGLTLDTEDLHSEKFVDVPLGGPTRKTTPTSPIDSVMSSREPQLSWFVTVASLLLVTVVRLIFYFVRLSLIPFSGCCFHCGLACRSYGRNFDDDQQRMGGARSASCGIIYCRMRKRYWCICQGSGYFEHQCRCWFFNC